MEKLLARPTLAQTVAQRQRAGEIGVFTNGCFDLLHLGHIAYLQQARALGDFLVVGLNSDASTRQIKGPKRPLVPEAERARILAALACVDYVTIFEEPTAAPTVATLEPAIYVKGGDYAGMGNERADYVLPAVDLRAILNGDTARYPELAGLAERLPEASVVAAYGGTVALLSYLPGHSTSELIERIVSRYAPPQAAPAIPRGG